MYSKYNIDCKDSPKKSLIFWIAKFMRHKAITLSTRQLKHKDIFLNVLKILNSNVDTIEQLILVKQKLTKAGRLPITTYSPILIKFYHFFLKSNIKSIKEINENIVNEFIFTSTSDFSIVTKNNYATVLRMLFAYIEDNSNENFHFHIELKSWRKNKVKNILPEYLEKEEVLRFLNTVEKADFSKKVLYRNRLIIKIILYTGIRIGEALGIENGNILLENDRYYIKIIAKGGKERVVSIDSSIIKEDFKQWDKIRDKKNKLFFHTTHGNEVNRSCFRLVIVKLLEKSGIKKNKMGPHLLRHTFATQLYRKSKDLILVQEALGHANIETSRIYTHLDKKHLQIPSNIYD